MHGRQGHIDKRMKIIIFTCLLTLCPVVLGKNSTGNDSSLMPNDEGIAEDDMRNGGCIDWQGKLVADGEKYVPNGSDMCMKCTCDKQFPIMCHSVACSPPLNCAKPKMVRGVCCEHICLDDVNGSGNSTDYNNGKEDDGESITNLSLRLIASTVTSFLVLALLLFMVHRLRQRRLLLAMRRFEARARQVHDDTDSEPYIPDAFLSLECPPYTDPPPPYSPPKPPQIMPGEQPPPYEEINQNGDANGNSANDNRNERMINGNASNSSGHGPPAAGAVQETGPSPGVSNEVVLGTGQNSAVCRSEMQGNSCNPGHQRSSSENLRTSRILPAYASTDVVEGLGVVISPGSETVSYTPYGDGWNTWRGSDAPDGRQSGGAQTLCNRNVTSSRERPRSLGHSRSCRVQEMPTTTAFQRFSNIFKRDSWRAKNRRRSGRPASEYHVPRQYATVPRHEQSIGQDVRSSHSQCQGCGRDRNSTRSRFPGGMCQDRNGHSQCQGCGRERNSTRPRLPDRMCLSYDGTQAPYNGGAISPSTSSSNSSCSTEPFHQHYSTTTTTTSSNGNSISPQGMNLSIYDDTLVNSFHRQQFQNDLRRHLPPLQTSDHNEPVNPNPPSSSQAGNISMTRSEPPLNSGSSTLPSQISRNPRSDSSLHQARQPASSDIANGYASGNGAPNTRSLAPVCNANVPHTSMPLFSHEPQSDLTIQEPNSHTQQSLASFIRSNPSATITDIRQHISERGIISPHPLSELNPSPDSLSHQTLPKYSSRSSYLPNSNRTTKNEGPVLEGNSDEGTGVKNIDESDGVTATLAFSYSSSPSPSPPVTALAGTMRRSHSGVSQASMFSVCSETGEKKLKAGEVDEDKTKVLSSDSQYPEYHSLPVSRPLSSKRDSRSYQSDVMKTSNSAIYNGNVEHPETRSSHFSEMAPPQSRDVVSNVNLPFTACATTNINSTSQHYTGQASGNNMNNPNNIPKGCEENKNNFNSVPVDKMVCKKGLPSVNEEEKIPQSVNIPPSALHTTLQSSKTSLKPVQSTVSSSGEPNNLVRSDKVSEVVKKSKKKRTKERSSSSPQFLNGNKSRHSTNSPKHHRFNLGARSKDKNFPPKSEEVCNEKEVRTKPSRASDKKLRNQPGASRQPVMFSDNSSKLMTRTVGPAPTLYGNADVYRGLGGDSLPSAVFPPPPMTCPPYSDPWHKDYQDNLENITSVRVGMNDLNQPPNYLKSQNSENHTGSHSYGASGKQDENCQSRKKSHRRQQSAGDKAGHIPSPQRHKFRPKSFVTPNDQLPEKRGDVSLPRPSVVSGDFAIVGKGAKSGFGHDLNFDDQTGIADFHIHDSDFNHKRLSLGHDTPQSNSSFYGKVGSRTDGQVETSRVGTQSGSNHPGSKSGLSNELSFVSRSAANNGRKKRQSLPALTSTFVPPSGLERKISCGAGPWQNESEGQGNKSQVQGERSFGHPDSVGTDSNEPASYV